MRVSLIKYGGGNVLSVSLALQRLGFEAVITDNPDEIASSDKVIFPGVGEASSTMHRLRETGLDKVIVTLKQPVLGICLGMQLLCSASEENDARCLALIPQVVRKFPSKLKVPQVGWNTVAGLKGELFREIPERSYFYFVHSYYVESGPFEIASSEYAVTYSAAVQCRNFYGVQFHPEKSGAIGAKVIKNFLDL